MNLKTNIINSKQDQLNDDVLSPPRPGESWFQSPMTSLSFSIHFPCSPNGPGHAFAGPGSWNL
uniref:CSON006033 protein n=1 Tax=Culicoides sonorensis TaxID=179676 RepID=A0A336LIU0_CULSO